VLIRDNMGKFSATQNNIYQQISGQLAGEIRKASYFNGTVYYGAEGDSVKPFSNRQRQTRDDAIVTDGNPVSVSRGNADDLRQWTNNGILWAVENGSPAVLHAYDATNLATELYNSNQAAGGRDQFVGTSSSPL